ncbi:hypothetical protein FAK_12320 [Desulfoferula mesophila]|uniref:Secreted protein n=1 Tax=Desulfoferula mesophila TaxID=3058419 RepID=A0AAU9EUF6_9BACT|nr:hypothetical protein FAK_12320 [Desulfoferula mesophilus]
MHPAPMSSLRFALGLIKWCSFTLGSVPVLEETEKPLDHVGGAVQGPNPHPISIWLGARTRLAYTFIMN